jgi:hypothetical protein
MRSCTRVLLLVAPALVILGAAQEESPGTLTASVRSMERREGAYRVTLVGEAPAVKEARLTLSIAPRRFKLDADRKTLVASTAPLGTGHVAAELKGTGYTAVFKATRLGEFEVRVLGGASSDGATIFLLDPASSAGTIRKNAKAFAEHARALKDFLETVLEPYSKLQGTVPERVARRLREIDKPLRAWSATAELSASASAVVRVLDDIWQMVPWEESVLGQNAKYDGVERPTRTRSIELAFWTDRLGKSWEVAVRESALKVLAPLAHFVDRHLTEGLPAASRPVLRSLVELSTELTAGELGEAYRAWEGAPAAAELVRQVQEALAGEAVLDEASREKLKELSARLKEALAQAARPASQ